MRIDDKSPVTDDPAATLEPRVKRRRDRMAGLWAAELLGLLGQAAHDYAHTLAHSHEPTEDDEKVASRLASDLKGKASLSEIRQKLAHFVQEARRQLRHEDGHKD